MHAVTTARCATVLFALGSDFDEPTEGGKNTVLHLFATYFGLNRRVVSRSDRVALLRFLIVNLHVDMNQKNTNGNTPLHVMILSEWIDGVQVLLELGADTTVVNVFHHTPEEVIQSKSSAFRNAAEKLFRQYDGSAAAGRHRCMT